MLNDSDYEIQIPLKITKEDIKNIYLKDKHKIRHKKIHLEPHIGIMNGLWANSLGMGGINPIECNWFPSKNFLELKLPVLFVIDLIKNFAQMSFKNSPNAIHNRPQTNFKLGFK